MSLAGDRGMSLAGDQEGQTKVVKTGSNSSTAKRLATGISITSNVSNLLVYIKDEEMLGIHHHQIW